MSSFFQSKSGRDARAANSIETHPEPAPVGQSPDLVSSVGRGMLVTGKVICPGILQIFGCVTGEIHAGQLVVCDEGSVDGEIAACSLELLHKDTEISIFNRVISSAPSGSNRVS